MGSALLFASGVGATAAWTTGLYANASLIGVVGLWLGGVILWRRARALPAAPPETGSAVSLLVARTEQQRLRATLDQVPVPLITLETDGVPRALNRAARVLFTTDDRILQATVREAFASSAGKRPVLRVGSAAAAQRTYAMSIATVAVPDGTHLLAALTDIGAELRAAEAAALRDLLRVLSHEIMNSLTPVVSLAGTAAELLSTGRHEDLVDAKNALETIERRAGGLDRFVSFYRTLARLPPPTLRPVSAAALIADAGRLFETTWRPRGVSFAAEPPLPDIIAPLDADLLTQALLNLLGNGAEAAMAFHAAPAVSLSATGGGEGIVFRVSDNGEGVLEGAEEAIFQPFFTTKPNGSGVGLGLARQIALSHGGSLTLEPRRGGTGAAFLLAI